MTPKWRQGHNSPANSHNQPSLDHPASLHMLAHQVWTINIGCASVDLQTSRKAQLQRWKEGGFIRPTELLRSPLTSPMSHGQHDHAKSHGEREACHAVSWKWQSTLICSRKCSVHEKEILLLTEGVWFNDWPDSGTQSKEEKTGREAEAEADRGYALITQGNPSSEWTCRRELRRGKSSENKEPLSCSYWDHHKTWAWFWLRLCLQKPVSLLCLWQSQRVLLPPGRMKMAIRWMFHPSTLRRRGESIPKGTKR